MRHIVKEAGLSDTVQVDSCATSREEIGNDIYPAAKQCLHRHGISFTRHAARQITPADYDAFDYILCMENYNIRNLRRVIGEDLFVADAQREQPKIHRLLDRDVADPWYTGDFETTYNDLVKGCETWLQRLGLMSVTR